MSKSKPKKVRINFDVDDTFRNQVKSHFAIQGKSIADGCRDILAKELLTNNKKKSA